MYICAAGDIHGALNKLYDEVLDFEASLGIRFDFVLHVGDFGIWPDPAKIDKGTRNHDGAGDFSAWLEATRVAPRRTVFIKGPIATFSACRPDSVWTICSRQPCGLHRRLLPATLVALCSTIGGA
jgi:hypothetical protein